MKKTYFLCPLLSLAIGFLSVSWANVSMLSHEDIAAESAILMEKNTGQILFEKKMHEPLYPASITKLMTAILILEDNGLDETVTIDAKTPFSDGNRIWVEEGEIFTVEQLLYATLVGSANDAAVALAKHHSGTVEAFCEKMNARAIEMGALNTNFTNPNGLPDTNHISTAYDMACIGRYASDLPELLSIVSTIEYKIPPTNKKNEPRTISNGNRFLYGTGSKNKIPYRGKNIDIKYDSVLGLKTGYTKAAGQTFVGYGKKGDKEMISVILKSQGKHLYIDTRTLLDYGFEFFKKVVLVQKGQTLDTLTFDDERKTKIPAVAANTLTVYLPKDTIDGSWNQTLSFDENLTLPLEAEKKLGTLSYTLNDKPLASTDLVTLKTISDKALLDETVKPLNTNNKANWKSIPWLSLFVRLVITLFLWRIVMTFVRVYKSQGKTVPKNKLNKKKNTLLKKSAKTKKKR